MLSNILTLLAATTLTSASCIPSIVQKIYNPPHQLPYTPSFPSADGSPGRLLIIGDVHGMRTELDALLEKTQFNATNGDRVIFAGDMINKGPDNAKVVELAMEINATSVRGNHEDRVLRTWAGAEVAKALRGEDSVEDYEKSLTSGERFALGTAREFTDEQRRWLAGLPLVLRLGQVPGYGEMAVVHGGMAPGVEVEDQEGWAMYNVRSVLYPDENGELETEKERQGFTTSVTSKLSDRRPGNKPSTEEVEAEKERMVEFYDAHAETPALPIDTNEGRWWVESWNEVQAAKPEGERLTLVYGHDSNRGVQLYDYSKGLDSRCVNGVMLTALVLSVQGEEVEEEIVSVDCEDGDIS